MRPLCSNKQPVKLKPLWTASLLVLVTMVTSARSEVVMGEDGGYRNLVVRISDSLDMNKCADIIQGVKVSQSQGVVPLNIRGCTSGLGMMDSIHTMIGGTLRSDVQCFTQVNDNEGSLEM